MIGLIFAAAILALVYSGYLIFHIVRQPSGNQKMIDIAGAVKTGATAYLYRQYKTLLPIVIIVAIIIGFALKSSITGFAFAFGAFLSALAGYVGMQISVRTNVKVAEKSKKGLKEGLSLAFKGGAVTGFSVVAFGLLGVSIMYYFFQDPSLIVGFGFGASLICLFMRVGGGIYTKAADVGADLVGKVEKGIPEDDPRNPAVIADQVGDNVGDCAGMSADVFESYVVTLIAAMLLGLSIGPKGVFFPLIIGAVGIIGSLIGAFFVKLGKDNNIWKALNKGILITALFSAIFFFIITKLYLNDLKYFFAALTGLGVTVLIGMITEYYTARDRRPVIEVAEASKTGAGTNIITGMAVGLQSTILPVLVIALAILLSFKFAGVYGIGLAALGMLSVTGIILAVDAFGPITDNAGGIAEMAGLPKNVRRVTDALDAVGNTTKAVTKGFAIGSAGLAALSLFVAFSEAANLQLVDLSLLNPAVVIGLFIGAALPFLFSSFLMKAVGRAAFQIVEEVRRQFKSIKGLMQGKAKPDYKKCVDITTRAALREFIIPGILAISAPILVGFILGPAALGGLLAGSIVTGLLMALFLANSGAAWDNAKKYIEDGKFGGKGSDAHKAAVIGDTVGDPAKDTAGPSLNPLIKVLNMIALLFASLFIYTII